MHAYTVNNPAPSTVDAGHRNPPALPARIEADQFTDIGNISMDVDMVPYLMGLSDRNPVRIVNKDAVQTIVARRNARACAAEGRPFVINSFLKVFKSRKPRPSEPLVPEPPSTPPRRTLKASGPPPLPRRNKPRMVVRDEDLDELAIVWRHKFEAFSL